MKTIYCSEGHIVIFEEAYKNKNQCPIHNIELTEKTKEEPIKEMEVR